MKLAAGFIVACGKSVGRDIDNEKRSSKTGLWHFGDERDRYHSRIFPEISREIGAA
ncbi:hypothetical protein [Bradyrhizobium sp. 5.13L]